VGHRGLALDEIVHRSGRNDERVLQHGVCGRVVSSGTSSGMSSHARSKWASADWMPP
jgi:hypothetical protein